MAGRRFMLDERRSRRRSLTLSPADLLTQVFARSILRVRGKGKLQLRAKPDMVEN